MGGCCALLRCSIHCPYLNLSLLQLTALGGEQSTFLRNDSTFVSSSTCFHLTSHILHVTHMLFLSSSSLLPSVLHSPLCSPLLSSPLLPISPQIIANHHMQSISFASGGDPVSHPTHTLSLSFAAFPLSSSLPHSPLLPLWQLKSYSGPFPSFFILHFFPSFLSSVIVGFC